ncbi:nucleotidyltransferase family protein [Anaerosolibacter sp.]|jgi:molybdenum cofactor cytidylyltransferase|uniref:nucleotidyltransferase family protein n=1 Tax=Anaerosolibacter sp. TaxID=1872527 RepID=UPI002602A87A|nr:nucleotidyltransferase family protein [Anaerosolibacter sp.]
MISGIILAAGKSSRMGQDKLSLMLHGRPLLEHVILAAKNSILHETIVVWGSYGNSRQLAEIHGLRAVENKDYEKGLSTSLMTGIKAICPDSKAVMFLLGDMPYIDAMIINRLIHTYHRNKKGIIVPLYEGQRGNPVLFSREYELDLCDVQGDMGARQLIEKYKEDVAWVPFHKRKWNRDIDTIEAYDLAKKGDEDGDEKGKD